MKKFNRPENQALKQELEADPKKMEAIVSIVLEIDRAYDSVDDFWADLAAYEERNKKSTSPSLAGA